MDLLVNLAQAKEEQGDVKNHKCKITVESELGKGKTFTVWLPVVREEITWMR